MKLDRVLGVIVVALGAAACGSHPPKQPARVAPPVSTTQLTAAQLDEADDAPQVGEMQQHSTSDDSLKEENIQKDEARRSGRAPRKQGSGFSGYK